MAQSILLRRQMIQYPLPAQVTRFSVSTGNAKATLSWRNPTSYFGGVLIVRKARSKPTKPTDGVKVYNGTGTSFTDTNLTNGTTYYWRAFPYNSKKQYQTSVVGAVVSGTPKAGILASSLPSRTLIVDPNTKYYNAPIMWKIADKNHSGYPANSVTLISDRILAIKPFDAKEPSNSDNNRRQWGNNRYKYSNIRQWLNSSASAGNWYSAQHQYDAPPNSNNVRYGKNAYENEAGFLHGFSSHMLSALLTTSIQIGRQSVDGGGYETVNDKIFLPSFTEIGLSQTSSSYESGFRLPIFAKYTDSTRQAKPTPQCTANSELVDSDLRSTLHWKYWLREPGSGHSAIADTVYSGRSTFPRTAYYEGIGFRPILNIKNNSLVSPTPNSDGSYNLL